MNTTPCCQPPGQPFDNKKRVIVIEEELLELQRGPAAMELQSYDREITELRSALKECATTSNNFLEAMKQWPQGTQGYADAFQNWFACIRDNPLIQQLLKGEKE